jgi:hypothetical protein
MLSLLRGDVSDDCHLSITRMAEHITDVHSEDRVVLSDGRVMHKSGMRPDDEPIGIKRSTYCGALAAATAALYSLHEEEDASGRHDELTDWFCGCYGGYDCETISAAPNFKRDHHCPMLILATYFRVRDHISHITTLEHLARKSLRH